ncbi:hypothetical protein [Paenibacillus tyrfis]|uniref:hypothetical protein n=1 Tax=Paenibacillus tyrfis TaxID=1501230 RepID=UPI0020A1163A|nr:hypothetical protein [Paenibacillus tyrfis]MCP1309966.1 hypothetical protein [Paenibacillus tyrfis]
MSKKLSLIFLSAIIAVSYNVAIASASTNVVYPASTSVAYYEGDFIKADRRSTYSGTFDMTSSSVTIHGWQDNGPGSKADMKYQIVIKSWTGDDLKGEKIIPDGYYPKDGTWYSEKITTLLPEL